MVHPVFMKLGIKMKNILVKDNLYQIKNSKFYKSLVTIKLFIVTNQNDKMCKWIYYLKVLLKIIELKKQLSYL